MGTNTIPSRSDGVPMPASWFNDIRSALMIDFVPRNASGIPTDEGGSLGDANYQWNNARVKNLYLDGTLMDSSALTGLPHRITGASQDSTTKFPDFLDPAGVAGGLSCDLLATATAFRAIINDVTTTVSADTTFSALTAAPAANNTCLVDDIGLAGAASTKILGELDSKEITIDTIGSEIDAIDGEIAAFLVGAEVFLALVDTSNNKLWPIYRGWAGTSRVALSNNDPITLLHINTLLLKNDGSTKVASDYCPETVTTSPAAGTAGKIYIERNTNKIGYDTGAAIDYGYMIVGYAICDDTDCLYADHWDLELYWKDDIDVNYVITTSTTLTIKSGSAVSVNGKIIRFTDDYAATTAANMDVGETMGADIAMYLYMREDGGLVFSRVAPRRYSAIKKGCYHPLKYFRCVGEAFTNIISTFLLRRAMRKNNETLRDEMVPEGTIVAWSGVCYSDNANTYSAGFAINSVAQVKLMLSEYWKICDGVEIYDPESLVFNVAGRHIENLTDDRFLMGDTVAGTPGGSNTSVYEHTHVFAHAHKWGETGAAPSLSTLVALDDASDEGTAMTTIMSSPEAFQDTGSGMERLTNWLPPQDCYTTGVLSPPTGSAGATAASAEGVVTGSDNNRPKYVTSFFIRKIK